jgi:hypothetical protein
MESVTERGFVCCNVVMCAVVMVRGEGGLLFGVMWCGVTGGY